jgi:hypothetical protein
MCNFPTPELALFCRKKDEENGKRLNARRNSIVLGRIVGYRLLLFASNPVLR